jgi:hypothetical protein
VRNRNTNILLRGTSILFISIAMVLTTVSLIGYSRQRNNYPAGMTIGGVPVGSRGMILWWTDGSKVRSVTAWAPAARCGSESPVPPR